MECDALVSVLNKALTLVFTVAAFLLGGGLPGVILAQGAAGLFALGLAVVLASRLDVGMLRATVAAGRELLVGGTPLVAMSLAVSAQGYLDAVVLSKLAPDQVVGWYGASKNILGTLIAPATILGSAAFPRFSRAAQDPARLGAELHAALRPLVLLAGFAAVGTYLFADVAISVIYGAARFAPSATILKVFAPGFFLLFVDVLLGAVVIASGRAAALAMAKFLNVVVSTGLELLLIPFCQARYGNGGIGAVLAFGGSEVMMFVAAAMILPKGVLAMASYLDLGRAALIAGATVLPFLLLPSLAPPLALVLATAIFVLLAVALRVLGRSDLELLASMLRRPAAPRRPRPAP
jgi:O-antigen/teichoic acid export membrane protein